MISMKYLNCIILTDMHCILSLTEIFYNVEPTHTLKGKTKLKGTTAVRRALRGLKLAVKLTLNTFH